MVLVLTLCQLSAINCTACKGSVIALTSLAVEDDVSSFFLLAQLNGLVPQISEANSGYILDLFLFSKICPI
jgi:hypothetical protein